MDAPKKLYVNVHDYLSRNGFFAFTTKCNNTDIEYTRTDAFIEEACAWFRTLDDKEPPYETTEEFIEGFKKAMKGEKV